LNGYIANIDPDLQALPGRIIAIEGIDQSGKRTQTQLLLRRIKQIGLEADRISFPIYHSPAGRQIRRFLEGKQDYPPEALHMLYSLNRWENQALIHDLVEKADFIVADRYTPSNLAYGVSRGLSLGWLKTLDRGLPLADLVLVLDVPVRSSFARKRKHRDAHETDRQLLFRVRRCYKMLADRLGWKIVDATASVGEVESNVWNLVARKFKLS
jgi:dTMP kinase